MCHDCSLFLDLSEACMFAKHFLCIIEISNIFHGIFILILISILTLILF